MSASGLRSAAWEKRYELLVGLILGVIVLYSLVQLIIYMVHSDGTKARFVGLPIPVQILPAEFRQLSESVGASGTIQPSEYTVITAKVVGRVEDVPVDLGSVVKPGTLLVGIDDSLYKAQLDSATEAYIHASNQLDRMRRLFEENLATVVNLDMTQAAKSTVLQNLISARIALANTKIRSPADAVVLQRGINPGQFTSTDEELMELGAVYPAMLVVDVG